MPQFCPVAREEFSFHPVRQQIVWRTARKNFVIAPSLSFLFSLFAGLSSAVRTSLLAELFLNRFLLRQ